MVLATLLSPATFHDQLPWSIFQLSQRALYYIAGEIRDVLAPYAAGTHYCPEILLLLNSIELYLTERL